MKDCKKCKYYKDYCVPYEPKGCFYVSIINKRYFNKSSNYICKNQSLFKLKRGSK